MLSPVCPPDPPHRLPCSLQGCKDRALCPPGPWLLVGPGGSRGDPGREGEECSLPGSLPSSPPLALAAVSCGPSSSGGPCPRGRRALGGLVTAPSPGPCRPGMDKLPTVASPTPPWVAQQPLRVSSILSLPW